MPIQQVFCDICYMFIIIDVNIFEGQTPKLT